MRIIKLDTTQNKRLCMGLRLMSLPAFIFYRDGQEVERISGQNISEDDLINAVKKFVGMEEK
jgi:thioredoxin 1